MVTRDLLLAQERWVAAGHCGGALVLAARRGALWWGVGACTAGWWCSHSLGLVAGCERGVRGKVRGLRTEDGGGTHVVQRGCNGGARCGDVVAGSRVVVAVWPQRSRASWHVAEGEGATRSSAGVARGQKTCWACGTSKSETEKKTNKKREKKT